MVITDLQQKLHEAYSTSNLNKISLTLIDFYRKRQFSVLKMIAGLISDTVNIEITDNGKGFSKFMMLYHPDRGKVHINEIDRLTKQNNYEGLLEYSHILKLCSIEDIAGSLENDEDIDYAPVYEWDFNVTGYSTHYDNGPYDDRSFKDNTLRICNFYDAIKIRVFENQDFEYPSYYLEDIDEFELSGSDIGDLDGAEYCIHARFMDLSDNWINDLTPLFGLLLLEELNLSENQIEYIDVLSNLINLKSLNLSGNMIRDLSPLFDLPKLSYVDLAGNSVDMEQVEELRELGVTVEL